MSAVENVSNGLLIHIGITGSARLHRLIRCALAGGVGASLKALQKRTKDVTKLLLSFAPTDILADLAAHFFPPGGIKTIAQWAIDNGGVSPRPTNA